ncbi:unnamed protein product [Didymodactylos carnosus]|uniref:Protein kinase domain-containing protein n=1 Tax=Didymodactylos carnosus TaxID=1234261 RepID=A0A815RSF7_9BILA|nr:unnamed protein product [Didymodactylos carnosus]CAF4345391.1 unnamed protein product [Didymodactylos carnosus]
MSNSNQLINEPSETGTHSSSNSLNSDIIWCPLRRIFNVVNIKQMVNEQSRRLAIKVESFYRPHQRDSNHKNTTIKMMSEPALTSSFESFLIEHYKPGKCLIVDTCNYKGLAFRGLFNDLRPDMLWLNSLNEENLIDTSFLPFNIVSVLELKTRELKNTNYNQLATYLSLVLRHSPGRTFIIGCLTNFNQTSIIKVSINSDNKFTYIASMCEQENLEGLNSFEILSLHLTLTAEQLGVNNCFKFPYESIIIQDWIGRGSSSFAFKCCNRGSDSCYVLKVSRDKSQYEYEVIEQLHKEKFISNLHDINIISTVALPVNKNDYLIGLNEIGVRMDKAKFLERKTLSDIWKQVNLGMNSEALYSHF